MCGSQHGLHLRILRVVDATGQPGSDVRLHGSKIVDGLGDHTTGPLISGQPVQSRKLPRVGSDDETPLVSYSNDDPASSANSSHRPAEYSARSNSGPGSLSDTRMLPSPAPVVPPATDPRSTTVTSQPARAQ